MRATPDEVATFLKSAKTHVYLCGLKGMESRRRRGVRRHLPQCRTRLGGFARRDARAGALSRGDVLTALVPIRASPRSPVQAGDPESNTWMPGFKCIGREDVWCRLEREGVTLMFMRNDHFGEPHATAIQYIYVNDLDALWDAIKDKVKAEWGPKKMPYGMMEFAIKDPDGYLLSFGEEMDKDTRSIRKWPGVTRPLNSHTPVIRATPPPPAAAPCGRRDNPSPPARRPSCAERRRAPAPSRYAASAPIIVRVVDVAEMADAEILAGDRPEARAVGNIEGARARVCGTRRRRGLPASSRAVMVGE